MRNCEVEVYITLGWSERKGGGEQNQCKTETALKCDDWAEACEDPRKSSLFSVFQVMCVQIKCFHEIITIGYNVYHSYDLPWFRTLSW